MHMIHESSRLSKKAIRALGLVLALSALTAASAQGADLVVPHSATHTVAPTAVPQPAAPQTTPQASVPSPSAAASPSSPALRASDEPGTGPGVISSLPSGNPVDDVGHNAGSEDKNRVLPWDLMDRLQARIGELTANLTFGLSDDPVRDMISIFKTGTILESVKDGVANPGGFKAEPPDDGDLLGISGVSTGQACGGGNYETYNRDIEDPSGGIIFC